jgi:hypothetical protein
MGLFTQIQEIKKSNLSSTLPIRQTTSRQIPENNRFYIVPCKNSEYDVNKD